ncbi:MAG: serine hydrolase, partial [Pontixanthobacter sp.]
MMRSARRIAVGLTVMWLSACSPDAPVPAPETAIIESQARSVEPEPAQTTPAMQKLVDDIAREGAAFPGSIAISVRPLEGGQAIAFQGDRLMPQQSVSKLWVALTAFDQAAKGALAWNERVRIMSGDLTLFYQPIEKIVARDGAFDTNFGDLVQRALASSDNTANDRLLRRVGGPAAVRATLEGKGLHDIRFGPGERDMQSAIAGMVWDQSFARGRVFYEQRAMVSDATRRRALSAYISDPVDGASANAITYALARLANGRLLPPPQTEQLLGILATTKSGPNRLKGGLAQGWSIAHKTGTGQVFEATHTGYNDVGILTSPTGARYAVAVMIAETEL